MNTEKKNKLDEYMDAHRDDLVRLGEELFAIPELGFKEFRTAEKAAAYLDSQGIPHEDGIAVTGFKAEIGEPGGYHIVLAADIDALAAQSGTGAVPIHSCGHSVQTAVMLHALSVIRESGILEGSGCRVSLIGTPAEEFIDFDYRAGLLKEGKIISYSGKQNMIREGVFDDADCVLSVHMNGEQDTLFDIDSTLTGFLVKKAVFHGQASHSGVAAHLGRNALQGANLAITALSYLQDRFTHEEGLQLHPVISSCSGGVNIIPDEAVLETYIRANTKEALERASALFDQCIRHCAAALDLTAEIGTIPGYLPLVQSAELNRVVEQALNMICPPEKILHHVVSGASGDVGDLASLLPTIQMGFSGMKGRFHSADFVISDKERAYMNPLRAMVYTTALLAEHPELRPQRKDFEKKKEEYLKKWLLQNP